MPPIDFSYFPVSKHQKFFSFEIVFFIFLGNQTVGHQILAIQIQKPKIENESKRKGSSKWTELIHWKRKHISLVKSIYPNEMKVRIKTWPIILCLRTFSLSRILIATFSPVSKFRANLTLAKLPSPRVRPSSYLPTRVLPLVLALDAMLPLSRRTTPSTQ